MKGVHLGNASTRPSSLSPVIVEQLAIRKRTDKRPRKLCQKQGCTQPRDGDEPAGRNESERPMAPVSVYPTNIAVRVGIEVAELPVVERRLVSMVDKSGKGNH
jgi:hypothetical protein